MAKLIGKSLQKNYRHMQCGGKGKMEPSHDTMDITPSLTYHHITPLVDLDGQVPVWLHPFGKRWVHDSFWCRSDGYRLHQVCVPAPRYPGYLRCKVCYVGLLSLKSTLGDKHGEVGILHTQLLDLSINKSWKMGVTMYHAQYYHTTILYCERNNTRTCTVSTCISICICI